MLDLFRADPGGAVALTRLDRDRAAFDPSRPRPAPPRFPSPPRTVDLHALVRLAVESSGPDGDGPDAAGAHDLELRATQHRVLAEPGRLLRALRGLIPDGVRPSLRTDDAGPGRVALTIGGDGPDRPADDPDLDDCRRLVEELGGRLRPAVDDASVVVELPALRPAAADRGLDAGEGRRLSVLLVDDEPDALRAISTVLRRLGHEVRTAGSLRSARSALAGASFDVLVSDLELGDGSGLDLLRGLPCPPPSILLSGYAEPADVARSRAAGFLAHLTKPVDFRRLDRVIRLAASAVAPRSPG